jgi:DNA-binding protein HU-beta
MNKKELIEKVHQNTYTGLTRSAVHDVVDALERTIEQAVDAGDSIYLRNLFTLRVKERPARKARNPQTGAQIDVPARKVVVIKPTANLSSWAGE